MPEAMLDELEVSDVALIEHAVMSFHPGLTVLTGETGAGKTALLHALSLVIGQRAEADMVRDGASQAQVQASFAFGARASASFARRFDEDDGGAAAPADGPAQRTEASGADDMARGTAPSFVREVVVSRRVSADGRSRCRIDGDMVAVGTLAEAIGPLIDLYGQHDHQTLLDPRNHLPLLDAFIGPELLQPAADYRAALSAYRDARRALLDARDLARNAEEAREQARFVRDAIEKVSPREDEYARLEGELPRLQHGDELMRCVEGALTALRGDDGEGTADARGACDLLATAVESIEQGLRVDPSLEAYHEGLRNALYSIEDVASSLRVYAESTEHDEDTLNATLDRLAELNGLMRRFGPRMEDVFDRLDQAQRTIELTDDAETTLARLGRQESDARAALVCAGEALDAVRVAHEGEFCEALSASVADLGMTGSTFSFERTSLEPDRWDKDGSCRYELLYAPGPGVTPRPLTRIASGGELSRIMLALSGQADTADTECIMVFDEIDAGIGGRTATAVADRLARLARYHQVIVVTHLPQIASRADEHLVVEKHLDGDRVHTDIRVIAGDERVAEIARMLSGTTDPTALAHARAMMDRTDG